MGAMATIARIPSLMMSCMFEFLSLGPSGFDDIRPLDSGEFVFDLAEVQRLSVQFLPGLRGGDQLQDRPVVRGGHLLTLDS